MPSSYVTPSDYSETQHDGTEHLAINNKFIRRFLTVLALHTTAKFHSQGYGLCTAISKNIIVKSGYGIHLTEAVTMRYIAENTNIPVPKVYCSFVHKNTAYIVMEKIQGKPLPVAWKDMPDDALEPILAQLKGFVQELRGLAPPPDTGVENCFGGSLYDSRIPRGNPRFGPFKTIQEFHFWLRHDFKLENYRGPAGDEDWHAAADMIRLQDGPWPPPKFTHGDLNPFNIIIRDGKIAGIIDWEFSGWYPDYWEYTSIWFGSRASTVWQGLIDRFVDPPDPEVFKMEELRNRWWGEF
ncbi:kinase-like domain-containing protein [Nemania sp. FL0031]|nr:kinase-like domain-containing protein [Nemania sp. FL0031]